MTAMRKLLKKRKKNKGVAMVMVIIAVAFVGMLVAMVLYMSYANFLMKSNDRRSKDNFYTAESALDIINVGLQKDISDCMAQAYVKTMQTSTGLTTEDMKAKFREYFVAYLSGPKFLQGNETDPKKYDVDHLINMWRDVVDIAAVEGAQGAFLCANEGKNDMIVSATNSYITLNNLHVVYTDAHGYVSIINTDINIQTPSMDFAEATNKMNIESYSLIANTQLMSDSLNARSGAASTLVTGNVFGGYDGIKLANQNSLTFNIDPNDAGDGQPHHYNLTAASINLDNVLSPGKSLETDKYYNTYMQDINVSTGRISLDGVTYVADDLDISGKRSNVTLKGKYYGYGNSDSGSSGSSSILINGADTVLNFADLEELMLSGQAYVGAMKYDADRDRQASAINASLDPTDTPVTAAGLTSDKITDVKDYKTNADAYDAALNTANENLPAGAQKKESVPQNISDVMTGESIAVKANQLLYLVPSECVGYIKGTDTQVVTKNPMTYDEYNLLANTVEEVVDNDGNAVIDPETNQTKVEKKYDVARLDPLWAKLGGTNYTDNYKPVFRRVNGTVMVYLYLNFANEQMANQFYRAYYEYDKEGIANYVSSYVSSITWNSAMKGGQARKSDGSAMNGVSNAGAKLSLAGNVFDLNSANELTLVRDNNDSEFSDAFIKRILANDDYSKKYMSLMHSTSEDYTVLSVADEGADIFDNLVKQSDLTDLSGTFTSESTGAVAEIRNYPAEGGVFIYPDECSSASNTHLIVTNGDVIVKADYEGLILAKGTIYVGAGCTSIRYNPTQTINSLRAKKTFGAEDKYAYQVFGKSGELTYGVLTPGEEEEDKEDDTSIKMVDLISYENWKKD